MKEALIIFVRNPEIGKVKTRLAATVGDETALDIYKKLLLHTMQVSNKSSADKFVFYHEQIEPFDIWNKKGFHKKLQSGNNLGEKMKNAFSFVFNEGYKKVIIIGSDCLQLNTNIINEAFAGLDQNDTVIGPANDGGYYLLGMKKMLAFLFEQKAWSTDTVYGHTLLDMQRCNLTTILLAVLTDVDTEADWEESKKAITCSAK